MEKTEKLPPCISDPEQTHGPCDKGGSCPHLPRKIVGLAHLWPRKEPIPGSGMSARELLAYADQHPGNYEEMLRIEQGLPAGTGLFSHRLPEKLDIEDKAVPWLVSGLLVSGANGFVGGEPKMICEGHRR